jgi:Zn-dependent peptidase ImmA (M78 family)
MKRADIETRARQILRDHNLLRVPVDPIAVANALGTRVLEAVFSKAEESGAVVRRGAQFSIFVNANEPSGRKRFTIAHEVGHQLLHMDSNVDGEYVDREDNFRTTGVPEEADWSPERKKEWEANAFAAALLMDESLVREKWQDCKDPITLSWMFQVSTTAMMVRLTQLGLLQQLS